MEEEEEVEEGGLRSFPLKWRHEGKGFEPKTCREWSVVSSHGGGQSPVLLPSILDGLDGGMGDG